MKTAMFWRIFAYVYVHLEKKTHMKFENSKPSLTKSHLNIHLIGQLNFLVPGKLNGFHFLSFKNSHKIFI
jgi:hypothetical protein